MSRDFSISFRDTPPRYFGSQKENQLKPQQKQNNMLVNEAKSDHNTKTTKLAKRNIVFRKCRDFWPREDFLLGEGANEVLCVGSTLLP